MPQQPEPLSAGMAAIIRALNNFNGLVVPGNINLTHRPRVHNPDGTISSVYSYTFKLPSGKAVLVPGVIRDQHGKWFTSQNPDQVWNYYKQTGSHLGIFKNVALADKYGELLHRQQAAMGPE